MPILSKTDNVALDEQNFGGVNARGFPEIYGS